MIWRQHDLKGRGECDGQDYFEQLMKVCASWTVYARYSPMTMQMDEAEQWLERVRSLKELLK